MKTFRTWLLVLLAVLLPIRGTVAAAMLCSPAEPAVASQLGEATVSAHHPAAHAAQPSHDDHHHAHHAPDAEDQRGSGIGQHHDGGSGIKHHGGSFEGSGSEKCNLCCDFCSVTPLTSALPSMPTPPDPGRMAFPDPIAAAASFLSDGQERPPRSC